MEELIGVFEQIEREKGILKQELLSLIESALSSAFKKHAGKKLNFEAHIDPDTGKIRAFVKKTAVEKVTNNNFQISLEQALKINPDAKIGDEVKIEIKTEEFGRIAAQTAKQVIIQRIRELERENLYKEFKEKEGTIVNGVVHRLGSKNVVILDLGKVEAILPKREQIPNHKYKIGERVKAYILNVDKISKGPQVIVSSTHPELVRRLFELEVPEVYDKTVEIKNIVRDPGKRCKVAVYSNNEKVDPVGACVGVKGTRIKAIINELYGERIDLVLWSEEPSVYIANALSPAKVENVVINKEKKETFVTVADDMLSLAIGKSGQNVRLAARLTGWHIDIKSESQRKKIIKEKVDQQKSVLLQIPGIGDKLVKNIYAAGFTSLETIVKSGRDALKGVSGIGEATAKKIYAYAKKQLEKNKEKKNGQKEKG